MKTISKEFEGIYGNGRPLAIRTNKTINNMLRNIPNKNYENNVSQNIPRNVSENIPRNMYDKEVDEFPYGVLIFMIILLVLGAIYYFREPIYNLLNSTQIEKEKERERLEKEQKEKEERERLEKNNIKLQEEIEKKKQEEIDKGGVKQLEEKINTLPGYKQEQLVKENSYCYIGTDNGQRECTNVYAGEICMSGQIFPKMEICINPNLRL